MTPPGHGGAGSPGRSERFHPERVFTERLALEGIEPSIGSLGDAYDNALMETINGLSLLKYPCWSPS